VYVTGRFKETVDFDPGPGEYPVASNGSGDGFLSRFDPMGKFKWVYTWSGVDDDAGDGVAVDSSGNAYVIGNYGASEVLVKVDTSGVVKGSYENTVDTSTNHGVDVDGLNNVYLTGSFEGSWLGPDGLYHNSNGMEDAFLLKLDSALNEWWLRTWGADYTDSAYSVAVTGSGFSYVTGEFEGTVDFDPGAGVDNHSDDGWFDAFLSKFLPNGYW
jgi:hypothetical protein